MVDYNLWLQSAIGNCRHRGECGCIPLCGTCELEWENCVCDQLVWCEKCQDERPVDLIRRSEFSVPREVCSECRTPFTNIVPNYDARMKAARLGEAGAFDGERKVVR